MTQFTAQVGQAGRVVIPLEIRATENIDKGDYVRLQLVAVVGKKK